MAKEDAVTALRRFGLGAKPGDVARIGADPRGYVLAALAKPAAARLDDPDLIASHIAWAEQRTAQLEQKQQRERMGAQMAAEPAPSTAAPPTMADTAGKADPGGKSGKGGPGSGDTPRPGQIRREVFRDEAAARIHRASTTDSPFLERLVMFWSGHFCVSANKGPVRVLAGAYEREAIRPHVCGRFADMLRAVAQHPAMLVYLDNAQSTGPTSRAGLGRGKGLNENLARELLELHTLGVDGGYTQTDVTNLARIITGWTFAGFEQTRVEPGRFMFAPQRHEPGAFTVLGRSYSGDGTSGGEKCLDDLARHPATARHIARKLAAHFVGSDPPPALVARLEKTFRDSDGDLKAVASALASADEAWTPTPLKVTPPYDFLVAIARGLALEPPAPELLRVMAALGQPLWAPPSPAGWPDDNDAWLAPSALRERLRVAEKAARQTDATVDPRAVAEDILGPSLSDMSRQAIARAETREQGLEILLMAPEFLRR